MNKIFSQLLYAYYYETENTDITQNINKEVVTLIKKNKHQEHIPDEIFNMGSDGINRAIMILQKIIDVHDHSIGLKLKWDGSPAVVFGTLPFDYNQYSKGTFFLGTKSVLAKNPKFATTEEELYTLYDINVAKKLANIFPYLQETKPKAILQGDLLWSDHNSKIKKRINGKDAILFTPNTITYGVIRQDNEALYNLIDSTPVGMVVHTKYVGDTFETLQASFDPQLNVDFFNTKNIWFGKTDVTTNGVFNDETIVKIKQIINQIQLINDKINPQVFAVLKQTKFNELFKMFINYTLVTENVIIGDIEAFIQKFIQWYKNKIEQMKQKVVSANTQQKYDMLFENNIAILDTHKQDIINILKIYKLINQVVTIIVHTLNVNNSSDLVTFLQEGENFNTTNHEGYVLVLKQDNSINKLIDRLQFSKINLMTSKNKYKR